MKNTAVATVVKKWLGDRKNQRILIPLIAITLGFAVGSLILIFSGINPIKLFYSLVRSVFGINIERIGSGKTVFNPRYIGEYLVYSMPIILTGLSVAFAFRTGLFNIGAEGQLMVGAFTAILLALTLPTPAIITLPLMIIAGGMAGAIWGFIPGFLKARFRVHEVVVTIMLNYAALYLTNYYYKQLPGSSNSKTVELAHELTLQSDFFAALTNNSRLHWGFLIVIAAIISFWFIIDKTTFGFELKAVGFNADAARYAGMRVERNAALSMMIAGAYAGLAGVIISIGTFGYGRVLPATEGYGFDGIAVALVGGNSALGSLFSGLLFGSLKAAQPIMQSTGIPREIAMIISSAIVIFVAMQKGIKIWLRRLGGDN